MPSIVNNPVFNMFYIQDFLIDIAILNIAIDSKNL